MCQTYIYIYIDLSKGSWKIKSNDKDFPFHPLFKKCLIQLTIFVWALIAGGFLQMDSVMLRWSPRRDKWRPCSCELEDSHLQWCWWNSWNDMCIEAEAWDLPNFSWFGMGFSMIVFTEERETLLMRLWFWWTVCLQSGCTQPGEPRKKKSFRHLLYAFGNPWFPLPYQLVVEIFSIFGCLPRKPLFQPGISWHPQNRWGW